MGHPLGDAASAVIKYVNINLPFFRLAQIQGAAGEVVSVEELVGGVKRLFNDCDEKRFRGCGRERERYNQVLRALGDNEFEVEHNGGERRPKKGLLQSMVDIDQAAY